MTNCSCFKQLKILLWKNFLVQCRHPYITILEILLPALISSLLLIGAFEIVNRRQNFRF